jgi:hypothetical protein
MTRRLGTWKACQVDLICKRAPRVWLERCYSYLNTRFGQSVSTGRHRGDPQADDEHQPEEG